MGRRDNWSRGRLGRHACALQSSLVAQQHGDPTRDVLLAQRPAPNAAFVGAGVRGKPALGKSQRG